MARRIENPRRPIAPELILRRNQDLCTDGDGTLQRLVHVRHVHEDDHGRAPVGRGYPALDGVRELGLNHQERVVDSHRNVNWRTIRAWSPHLLDCSKRSRAEVHLGFRTLADEHRKDGLHASWYRLDRHRHDSSVSSKGPSILSTLGAVLPGEVAPLQKGSSPGALRTTTISPDAQSSFTEVNSVRRSRSWINTGTFGACPSGQFGWGNRSSMR